LVIVLISFFAVAFVVFLFVFFLVRFFAKADIANGQVITGVCVEIFLAYCAHAQWYASLHYAENAWSISKGADLMQPVEAGVLYFALVFGAGFVLGTVRTLWVVPRVGTRTAELTEAPIMLVVTIVAARWTVLRLEVPPMPFARLEMGCFALVLMLLAEFGFVLWARGMSIKDYLATRDPVSNVAYYLLLIIFAVMPVLIARK